MRVNYLTQLSAMVVLLIVAAARANDEAAPPATSPALASPAPTTLASALPAPTTSASVAPVPTGSASVATVAPVAAAAAGDTATYCDDSDPVRDFIARAGGWGVHQTGSPTKVDEYQSPNSSPFWNVDGIMSDGNRTVDLTATGSDNDDQMAHVHFYGGPRLEADVDWEQFPHQLDSHDYAGWNYLGQNNTAGPVFKTTGGLHNSGPGNPQNPENVVLFTDNNLSPGQDFAIRVQEFKAKFQGHLTDNLLWKVDVFGIDKEGDRQANVFQHCSAAARATRSDPCRRRCPWAGRPSPPPTRTSPASVTSSASPSTSTGRPRKSTRRWSFAWIATLRWSIHTWSARSRRTIKRWPTTMTPP